MLHIELLASKVVPEARVVGVRAAHLGRGAGAAIRAVAVARVTEVVAVATATEVVAVAIAVV